jgi:hypothetical protein
MDFLSGKRWGNGESAHAEMNDWRGAGPEAGPEMSPEADGRYLGI